MHKVTKRMARRTWSCLFNSDVLDVASSGPSADFDLNVRDIRAPKEAPQSLRRAAETKEDSAFPALGNKTSKTLIVRHHFDQVHPFRPLQPTTHYQQASSRQSRYHFEKTPQTNRADGLLTRPETIFPLRCMLFAFTSISTFTKLSMGLIRAFDYTHITNTHSSTFITAIRRMTEPCNWQGHR